jgi:uncharacterized protein YjdB
VGGNNPRTENEELSGDQGTTYKIKNRSNVAYSLESTEIPLLEGVFEEDKTIVFTYNARNVKPTSIVAVPTEMYLMLGQSKEIGYEVLPSGATEGDVSYKVQDDSQMVVELQGNEVTAIASGTVTILVTMTGTDYELETSCIVTVEGV